MQHLLADELLCSSTAHGWRAVSLGPGCSGTETHYGCQRLTSPMCHTSTPQEPDNWKNTDAVLIQCLQDLIQILANPDLGVYHTPERSIFFKKQINISFIRSVICYIFCFPESVKMEPSELTWIERQSRHSLARPLGVLAIGPKPPSWSTVHDLTAAFGKHFWGHLPCAKHWDKTASNTQFRC